VNLREIGNLRGVSISCGYVLRGSEFYICTYVLDTETNQSLTTAIHRHFNTPTSLRPRHFDSQSHFSSPFLVLETLKLEPSRTKKNTPPRAEESKEAHSQEGASLARRSHTPKKEPHSQEGAHFQDRDPTTKKPRCPRRQRQRPLLLFQWRCPSSKPWLKICDYE
jgi:hypothetical protein